MLCTLAMRQILPDLVLPVMLEYTCWTCSFIDEEAMSYTACRRSAKPWPAQLVTTTHGPVDEVLSCSLLSRVVRFWLHKYTFLLVLRASRLVLYEVINRVLAFCELTCGWFHHSKRLLWSGQLDQRWLIFHWIWSLRSGVRAGLW